MQQKEMNKDQQNKLNRKLISKINTISQSLVGVILPADYVVVPSSNLITFDIPKKPYRILKIKEWLEEEKWKKIKPVGASWEPMYSKDAEKELTKILTEELSKWIQKEQMKRSPKEIKEEEKIDELLKKLANENGDTFKSKPNKR